MPGWANTGPQVPTSSVPGTWNTENGPVPVFFQTYNVCDTGGNCSLVHVIVTQDWLNLSIRDIQYGNGQTMTPAQNLLSAQYLLNEMGQLAELHQQAYIGNALDDAEWSLKTNVTHLRHIRPDPPSSQSLPGMVLYQIVTDKGAVKLTHT